jgi:hypothetical protein
MLEIELKPCPFCGGTNLIIRYVTEYDKPSMNDHWQIGCLSVDSEGWTCGVILKCSGSKIQMIEKWNRRVEELKEDDNDFQWSPADQGM